MTHTYLLEIGLEDLPAQMIVPAEKQFAEKTAAFLHENRINFDSIKTYSTPRRLAVQVLGMAEKQEDEELSVRGPSRKIAQDVETGVWTKAAEGFARGQGASTEDIIFKDVAGEDYAFIEKHIDGEPVGHVLPKMADIVAGLEFPKNMKWGNHSYQYIRPLHWLVSLLDEEIIPLEVFDIQAGQRTEGHRFFGHPRDLLHAEDYEKVLAEELVIADRSKRQAMISEQIRNLCTEKDWQEPTQYTDLLDEVTDLVEYPTVFYAKYNKDFLEVPDIVLQTSMISHQRYFPVADLSGELLPYFIGVRNGTDRNIEEIAQGNEKVLAARLADAKFFYEEDQKTQLDEWLEKLEHVDFHAKLGTLADKQRRVVKMVQPLADIYTLSDEETQALERAAHIYKFDLVTAMVDEFSELQGVMGEIYALEKGESPVVAAAIGQQYRPESPEDGLPDSRVAKLLSLADKLDTLIHFFAIGLKPTGSNDPFALRRQANGVVRIIRALDEPISFHTLIKQLLAALDDEKLTEMFTEKEVAFHEFFAERLSQLLSQKGDIPHDVRQAILGAARDDFASMIKMAHIAKEAQNESSFKATLESINRVLNLAVKSKQAVIDEQAFETQSESELYSHILRVQSVFEETTDPAPRFKAVESLQPSIDAFFEKNMVMVDDEKTRENRLALLKAIADYANELADFSRFVY